jgi:hypothetical protein
MLPTVKEVPPEAKVTDLSPVTAAAVVPSVSLVIPAPVEIAIPLSVVVERAKLTPPPVLTLVTLAAPSLTAPAITEPETEISALAEEAKTAEKIAVTAKVSFFIIISFLRNV